MTTVLPDQVIDHFQVAFTRLSSQATKQRSEPIRNRKLRLQKLKDWTIENRSAIHQAMFNDFSKAAVEVDGIEIFHVLNEIKVAINNLADWTKAKLVDAPITMLGTRSHVQYEPKGTCLIIAPWNYPFSLAVGPLVSAVAAGNTVVIKPSELTPNVSALLKKMSEDVFTPDEVMVFEGGPEVSKGLLKLPFDHIFFTGSPAIGKLVMKAAAENLTSVTLELGGKSPVVITDTANINDAAERTAVAKFVNNGQTCIAPDYILVDEKISKRFLSAFIQKTKDLFAENNRFDKSRSYCRIVNDRHFQRLEDLVHDALRSGAICEWNGENDPPSRFFHPTVLSNVQAESRIMTEEIFGPVLPVISYKTIDEAIRIINGKPKPLALYIFSTSSAAQRRVLLETSSGGVCINDCGIHFLHHNLPFGGVNNSGIGKSHGHYGFLAFSNEKPVLKQRSGWTSVKAFYPPYTDRSKRLMDWFLKLF